MNGFNQTTTSITQSTPVTSNNQETKSNFAKTLPNRDTTRDSSRVSFINLKFKFQFNFNINEKNKRVKPVCMRV